MGRPKAVARPNSSLRRPRSMTTFSDGRKILNIRIGKARGPIEVEVKTGRRWDENGRSLKFWNKDKTMTVKNGVHPGPNWENGPKIKLFQPSG